MADPSSIVFPLRVAVLERLWGQPFDGLNYEKESGVIKTWASRSQYQNETLG